MAAIQNQAMGLIRGDANQLSNSPAALYEFYWLVHPIFERGQKNSDTFGLLLLTYSKINYFLVPASQPFTMKKIGQIKKKTEILRTVATSNIGDKRPRALIKIGNFGK